MADWTSGHVIIHSCTPHQVRAAATVLENYSLATEDQPDARKVVNLGDAYESGGGFRCGDAEELAHDLIAAAPDALFTVVEEPAYEYLGTTCLYVPNLGLFTADCNNYGNPLFTLETVLALDDEPAEVRQRQLGVPWLTAIEDTPQADTVLEPDSYVTHWDRRSGEVIVIEGKICGGDLLFAAPPPFGDTESSSVAPAEGSGPSRPPKTTVVDAALTEHGFMRAHAWVPLDETSRIWRTDVYRQPPR